MIMASCSPKTSLLLFFFVFFIAVDAVIAHEKPEHRSFARTITGEESAEHGFFELCKNSTQTELHFYFHDLVAPPTPTAIRVAEAPSTNKSATGFGAVVVIDDPLTEGPNQSSKLVGRAQGMYALASQEEAGLLMAMNFAFIDGEFNGSSLAVLGRNTVFSHVREMPVVGGSGRFRFARGYALAKTYEFDLITGNTIVEYNVFVMHC